MTARAMSLIIKMSGTAQISIGEETFYLKMKKIEKIEGGFMTAEELEKFKESLGDDVEIHQVGTEELNEINEQLKMMNIFRDMKIHRIQNIVVALGLVAGITFLTRYFDNYWLMFFYILPLALGW